MATLLPAIKILSLPVAHPIETPSFVERLTQIGDEIIRVGGL